MYDVEDLGFRFQNSLTLSTFLELFLMLSLFPFNFIFSSSAAHWPIHSLTPTPGAYCYTSYTVQE